MAQNPFGDILSANSAAAPAYNPSDPFGDIVTSANIKKPGLGMKQEPGLEQTSSIAGVVSPLLDATLKVVGGLTRKPPEEGSESRGGYAESALRSVTRGAVVGVPKVVGGAMELAGMNVDDPRATVDQEVSGQQRRLDSAGGIVRGAPMGPEDVDAAIERGETPRQGAYGFKPRESMTAAERQAETADIRSSVESKRKVYQSLRESLRAVGRAFFIDKMTDKELDQHVSGLLQKGGVGLQNFSASTEKSLPGLQPDKAFQRRSTLENLMHDPLMAVTVYGGENLPNFALSVGAYFVAGPGGAAFTSIGLEAGDSFTSNKDYLIKKYGSIDSIPPEEWASLIDTSNVVGVGAGLLDILPIVGLFKKSGLDKQFNKNLSQRAMFWSAQRLAAGKGLKTAASEMTTEAFQEMIQIAGEETIGQRHTLSDKFNRVLQAVVAAGPVGYGAGHVAGLQEVNGGEAGMAPGSQNTVVSPNKRKDKETPGDLEDVLRGAGFFDETGTAKKPEQPRLGLLPAPRIIVNTEGQAGTPAQFESRERDLGITSDIQRAINRGAQFDRNAPTPEQTVPVLGQSETSAEVPPPSVPKATYFDKRLSRPTYRTLLEKAKADLVIGGGIAVVPDQDALARRGESDPGIDLTNLVDDPHAPKRRTQSLNHPWVQDLLQFHGMTVDQLQTAIDKSLAGDRLGIRQAAAVRNDRSNIEYRKAELERARQLRRSARTGLPPDFVHDDMADLHAGQLFEENEYLPEWTGEARSLYELAQEARGLDEVAYETLAEDNRYSDEADFAAALWQFIAERQNEQNQQSAALDESGAVGDRQGEVGDQAGYQAPPPTEPAGSPQGSRQTAVTVQPADLPAVGTGTGTPPQGGVSVSTVEHDLFGDIVPQPVEAAPAAPSPQTDLFGPAPAKEQAVHDARLAKDSERDGKEHVPVESGDGDLFSGKSRQTDIEDASSEPAKPAKVEEPNKKPDDPTQTELLAETVKEAAQAMTEAVKTLTEVVKSTKEENKTESTPLDALRNDKKFRSVLKDYGDPNIDSPVASDFAQGWTDQKDGKDPDAKYLSNIDGARPDGYNPTNPYLSGYLSAKDGKAVKVREHASGDAIGKAKALGRLAEEQTTRELGEFTPDEDIDTDVSESGNPIDQAAHEAATSPQNDLPQPTEAQKEAGNYAKGHVVIGELDISIENPAGSKRRPEWPEMKSHYGYIKGTIGKDKDHLDVFVKPGTAEDYSGPVFVVDQTNRDDAFDEHKIMLGWPDEAGARAGYLENYTKGWTGLGAIKKFTLPEFKMWLKDGETKKPVALKGKKLAPKTASKTFDDYFAEREARAKSFGRDKIMEETRNALAGMTLGRDFGESVEAFYARRPDLKTKADAYQAFLNWEKPKTVETTDGKQKPLTPELSLKLIGLYKITENAQQGIRKFDPKPGPGGEYVHVSRAKATTRNARADQAAELWQQKRKEFGKALREVASQGYEIPQHYIDLAGSAFEYDDSGKYSPIGKTVAKPESLEPAKPVAQPAETTVKPSGFFDTHKAFFDRLNDGKASVEEYRKAFEDVVANEAAITAELTGMTKDVLLKTGGGMFAFRNKNEKKDRVIRSFYDRMLNDFNLSDTLSFEFGANYKQSMIDAIRKKVNAATTETLLKHAEKIKAIRAERKQKAEQVVEAVKDPKTLDDYAILMRAKINGGMSFTEARMSLTPEQRIRFDEMAAEATRKERAERKTAERTTVRAAGATAGAEIVATKHTQKGYDLFVVKPAERVERDVYNTWNATAKKLGGWYSAYNKGGAVPGFQFKDRESAEAFQKFVSGGDTQAVQEQAKARRDAYADDRSQTAVERLREMAGSLEARADESLGQDRKVNTERRARMAASAEANANHSKALAATMRNIADAIDSGRAKFLDKVRTKAQVEMLNGFISTAKWKELRATYKDYGDQEKHKYDKPTAETVEYAEWPTFSAYRSDLANLGRKFLEIDGLKQIGQRLVKVADDISAVYIKWAKENLDRISHFKTQGGSRPVFPTQDAAEAAILRSGYKGKGVSIPIKRGQHMVVMSPSEARRNGLWEGDDDKRITLSPDFGNEIVEKAGRLTWRDGVIIPHQFQTAHEERKRFATMGIETSAEMRAALREFIAAREAPPAPDKVKEMERAMIGRRKDGLDFFPTPADQADEMVQSAGIEEGMTVLEPSAGMGHIADRIREAGHEPDVVELSGDRRELLEAKGYNVVGSDFMDMTTENTPDGKGYDRIVMNPPFSDRRDMLHVQHAYGLLKPGGRLVAIMGEGVFFGSDKKAGEFREWLESVGGTDEKLDEGSFQDASLPVNTGVNARMVVVDKPAGNVSYSRRRQTTAIDNALRDFHDKWEKAGVSNWVSTGPAGNIILSEVIVPKGERGKGVGTKFMRDLTDIADAHGAVITLTPDKSFGATSVDRLKLFYSRFGFVKNAGRKKDFRYMDTMLRRPEGEPKFSRRQIPLTGRPVSDAWSMLVQDDDAFQQPTSTKTGMREIAAEIDPDMNVEDETWLNKDKSVKHRWKVVMPDNRTATVTETVHGRLILNATRLKPGESRGTALYNLVATYAHNNGKIFIGDPLGLSPAAMYRRMENMISSILRFGTSDHIVPHPDQVRKFNLQWKQGDTAGNLNQLLLASYNSVVKFAPEIKDVAYNFDTNQFEKAGQPFSDADFERLSNETRRSGRAGSEGGAAQSRASLRDVSVDGAGDAGGGKTPFPIGRTTLKRAALTGTVLRRTGGEASESRQILGELVRQLREGVADTPLEEILYQRTGTRPRGGFSASAVEEIIAPILRRWKNAPEITVVQSVEDIPESAAPHDVEGAYMGNSRIYLVADNLTTRARVMQVLAHEAIGHSAMEDVFGSDLPAILREVGLMENAGNKAVREAAQQVDEMQPGLDENNRAKEIIAVMAERGVQNSVVKRVLAAIRKFLRSIGIDLEFSDADLAGLIRAAELYLEGGESATAAGVAAPAYSTQAPPWYSALERGLATAKQGKAPANDWKVILSKLPGVKQDELDWIGVNEWLDSQEGQVTREALLDFIRANQVEVREAMKGEGQRERDNNVGVSRSTDGEGETFDLWDGDTLVDSFESEDEAIAARDDYLREHYVKNESGTKFASYQLPGGENYRELLLTLPERDAGVSDNLQWRQSARGLWAWFDGNKQVSGAFPNQDDAETARPTAKSARFRDKANFRSAHFDEPNILAHVRFNERTDAEGKRALFIEEVQSDWHQRGRKSGYGKSIDPRDIAQNIENAKDWLRERGINPEEDYGYTDPQDYVQLARSRGFQGPEPQTSGVPDAPFKTTWPMLAMKRMIRYAAENGFDRIAWTTGEQQAARYDLSKQVDSIAAVKMEDGKYRIDATKKGERVISKAVTEQELPDVVGKDLAEKIIKGEGGDLDNFSGVRRYSGVDLKVGGEGMKAFYDQMLPSMVNKYVKKFGGKIGETEIDTGTKGGEWAVIDATDEGGQQVLARFETMEAAHRALKDYDGGVDVKHIPTGVARVPSIDITDSMRESVMQGQALFSRNPKPTDEVDPGLLHVYRKKAKTVIDRIDKAFDPLGSLPDNREYLAPRYRALGVIAKVDEIAKGISVAFGDANEVDKKALYEYFTNRDADLGAIQNEMIRGEAKRAKALINSVGDALVARGLLDAETREAHRDAYLPRLYLKHLLSGQDWKALGAGKKPSDMGYLKGRKDIPEEVRRVILGEITDPAFLAATAIAKPARDMALLDFMDYVAGHEKWVMPNSVVEFDGNRATPQYLKHEADRLRRQADHYTPEDATKARGLAERMDRAANEALEAMGVGDVDMKQYKQFPNSSRYGRMRGLWARKEIHDDLVGMDKLFDADPNWLQSLLGFGGVGTKATQIWKMGKVALNPPAQIRNFVSNGVMLQLSGVPLHKVPVYVTRAFKQIADNGQYWRIAKKYGVTESTFATQELYRIKRDLLDLEMREGHLNPLGHLHRIAAIVADGAGDIYQKSEALFKTAKIMHAMESGMSEADAAIEAQKWMFDYSLVPNWVRYARNSPFGMPFLTYQYKVLPRMLEVAALHPQRLIPWIALFYGAQMAVAAMLDVDDDDIDKLKKALPKWLQERGHVMFLPFKDGQGRWQFVDLGYFMPWSMYTELLGNLKRGEIGRAVQGAGLFSGPVTNVVVAIQTGRDPFTDRTIWNEGDPPKRQLLAAINYAWDMMMPPIVSSRGLVSPMGLLDKEYGGKIVQASTGRTNRYGDPTATPIQSALYPFGVNLYSIEPSHTRAQNIHQMKYDIIDVTRRLKQKMSNRALDDDERAALAREYQEEITRRHEQLRKYIEDSEIHQRLR